MIKEDCIEFAPHDGGKDKAWYNGGQVRRRMPTIGHGHDKNQAVHESKILIMETGGRYQPLGTGMKIRIVLQTKVVRCLN